MKTQEEQNCIDKGYKFLGWQVHTENCEDIKKCFEKGHYGEKKPIEGDPFSDYEIVNKKVHDKQHTRTGSDCTYWCDECKHYWKIDMSD